MIFDKLCKIIDKYSYSCNYDCNYKCDKEISILTNETQEKTLNKTQEKTLNKLFDNYKLMKMRSEVDDFDQSCIIIFYKNIVTLTQQTINFINEYISKNKTIIIIVLVDFDFNLLVKNINATSIDAISWKTNDGKQYESYIVVINKD